MEQNRDATNVATLRLDRLIDLVECFRDLLSAKIVLANLLSARFVLGAGNVKILMLPPSLASNTRLNLAVGGR